MTRSRDSGSSDGPKQPFSQKIPNEKWRKLIAMLAYRGNVRWACERAGISSTAAYRRRREDKRFRRDWDAALERSDEY